MRGELAARAPWPAGLALTVLYAVPALAQNDAPAQQGSGVFSLGSLIQLGCIMGLGALAAQLVMLTLAAKWVGIEGGIGRSFVAILLEAVITVVMLLPILFVVGNSLNEWAAGILVQAVSVLALCVSVKWLFDADFKRALLTVLLALTMTTVVLSIGLVLLYGN